MIVYLENGITAKWHGGHYVNLYECGENIDCISFAWEKDKPTQLDALQSLLVWLSMEETVSDPSDKVEA